MEQSSTPSPSDLEVQRGGTRPTPRRPAATESARRFHEALRKREPHVPPVPFLSRLLFWRQAKTPRNRRGLMIVWCLLFVQFLFSLFIIGHDVLELDGMQSTFGNRTAVLGGVILVAGQLLWLRVVNALLREVRAADTARAVAGGSMAELVELHFDEWKLSSAERDVALFTLKGFETNEIADLRHATQGTVRVQLAQIYGKAGVHTRCAFQSLFFEDMLDLSEQRAEEIASA